MTFIGRWLRGDLRAAVALAYLCTIASLAILAPVVAPFSPTDQDFNAILVEPGLKHFLGADDLGRYVLSRLM
jgi:peptide/nickel transport system permease protein